MDASDGLRCESVHDQNVTLRCEFVHNNVDCQCSEGFFNYIDFIYCDNIQGDVTEALAIYSAWSFFLFFILGLTAESFFCPSLVVISRSLSLSQNVAGVTFLAFGNGASDIFASLAAATQNRPELVISGLFGAGIFVTCAVAGAIMIATPFKINEEAFLRDIIFYLAAAYWAFAVYYNGQVRPVDAFGFLGLYVLYILVVLLVPYFHRKLYDSTEYDELGESIGFNSSVSPLPVYCTPLCLAAGKEVVCNGFEKSGLTETTPLLRKPRSSNNKITMNAKLKNLCRALNPVDINQWRTASWYWKMVIVIKAPAIFILKLTIPVIDYDAPCHNWSQLLNAFHCIIGPCFVIFATRTGHVVVGDVVSIWVVVLIIGVVGALVVFCTSLDHKKPKYHSAFGYFGFVTSIVWIYIMANEIVNVLKVIGIVLNINDATLGLTILAWGNSIGDFVANFSVSRKGSPMMGISACYGGSLFNLLVGMGLPFTIETFRRPTHIKVTYDPSVTILSIFLFASLLSTMVAMLITKFQVRKRYGFYLLFLYVAFVVCAIYNAVASS